MMKKLKFKLCKTGFSAFISIALTVATVIFPAAKSFSGTAEFSEAMRALGAIKAMNNIQPIMLNPVNKAKVSKVYLEVYDSTGTGMIPVDLIKSKLEGKFTQMGYTVTQNATEAGYVIQLNFNNIYVGEEKKGSSGFLGSILGTVGGYAGTVLGIAGGPLGIQLGAQLGAKVGESLGDVAESQAMKALSGGKYQFFGTVAVKVIENVDNSTTTYNGQYPVMGKNEKFTAEKFADDLVASLDSSVLKVFKK